ncbi:MULTISPECIES: D-glutamate cyclase family protein [unclassified Pseudomonas]|uniref:D-glutamate cyclase family protein n=1 Tax=unclassified Pseudomonas TaxID=196821 RepID=UPI000BCDC824|nr:MULTISPECIES: DUF1445 domain-containing protein [unclassified Pseudomonas]PVZ12486.1 uncharacterized protein YcsI (UPF0317 family) [Pseudomonas sp. URIL14HWK12:I12]PVZ23362.1 uncharacterized protein YcsI (UPF0317 family) [Pseudomonas sp. URIL14HWK12:I10]PVZ32692.1 uncharacterized protein YcsI (UPF0317 family) [Pseudomonas sp. URIL14HWK12:I11]SNZ13846.1 Uncharacterized protein YcsI, UPF0317 family [Pseudomonas sp. URIL14HWK12:I9]
MNPTSPAQLRQWIAQGQWPGPTSGVLDDYQQANLAVVPADYAYDFLLFCTRNPKSCPVIAVTEPGNPFVGGIDLRCMLARYRVWEYGELVEEPCDLLQRWPGDAVAFLLGCSHTFDAPLRRAGIPVAATAPAVYVTDRLCEPAGRLSGPLVVSMRPVAAAKVARAVEVTARYPTGHGAPVHIGDPAQLGIADLAKPDFGVLPPMAPGAVPVFWACGVTPQLVLPKLKAPYVFTHYAGHMLVMDERVDEM